MRPTWTWCCARVPFIAPSIPVLKQSSPTGPQWIHEVKFDGWRAQLHKTGDDVVIFSRNGHDLTRRFVPISDSLLARQRDRPSSRSRLSLAMRTASRTSKRSWPTSTRACALGASISWSSTGAICTLCRCFGESSYCASCSSRPTTAASYCSTPVRCSRRRRSPTRLPTGSTPRRYRGPAPTVFIGNLMLGWGVVVEEHGEAVRGVGPQRNTFQANWSRNRQRRRDVLYHSSRRTVMMCVSLMFLQGA